MNLTLKRNDLKPEYRDLPVKDLAFFHFTSKAQEKIRLKMQIVFEDQKTQSTCMIFSDEETVIKSDNDNYTNNARL